MDPQTRKVVLIPRFTSFVSARTYYTMPMNVREFESANITVWQSNGIGTSPTVSVEIHRSTDLLTWDLVTTIAPTPGDDNGSTGSAPFSLDWIRLAIVVAGTNPGLTCWAVGEFVERAKAGD